MTNVGLLYWLRLSLGLLGDCYKNHILQWTYTPWAQEGSERPNPSSSWTGAGCHGDHTCSPLPTAGARHRHPHIPTTGTSSRSWGRCLWRHFGRSCSNDWCRERWSWGMTDVEGHVFSKWLHGRGMQRETERKGGDSRGEAEHTDVLPNVPAVEELREGQVRTRGGGRLRVQLCRTKRHQKCFSIYKDWGTKRSYKWKSRKMDVVILKCFSF